MSRTPGDKNLFQIDEYASMSNTRRAAFQGSGHRALLSTRPHGSAGLSLASLAHD